MTCVTVFFGGLLRRLLSFYYLALRAPDRGVPAWKVRAGRSVSSPWPESMASFFGAMFFGFEARHRRRQHHAGVVIPAPRAIEVRFRSATRWRITKIAPAVRNFVMRPF